MNKGARRPPAVTGSITIDNSGMPIMENPPPNAPFMKQIRNTPGKATRIVAAVSSMRLTPQLPRARVHLGAGRSRRGEQPRRPSCTHPRGRGDEAVDRRFDLGTRDTHVLQDAVVEFVEGRSSGATNEVAGDPLPTGAE